MFIEYEMYYKLSGISVGNKRDSIQLLKHRSMTYCSSHDKIIPSCLNN